MEKIFYVNVFAEIIFLNTISIVNSTKRDLSLTIESQARMFGNKPVSPINSTVKSKSIRPLSIVKRLSTKGLEDFNNKRTSNHETIDTFL